MAGPITKNLWCRDTRGQEVVRILGFNPFTEEKGCRVRECTYGKECKGAHSLSEFIITPHINRWLKLNKATFPFCDLHNEIVNVIKSDKVKIKDNNDLVIKINTIDTMNFIEQLNLWHDLSCYYRKMAKTLHKKYEWKSAVPPPINPQGYIFADDVPCFYLSEKTEDYAWAFDRITRVCNMHSRFKSKVSLKQKVTIRDLCLGEMNCKEGTHYVDEQVCVDNFLTGSCSCVSKAEFDTQKQNIINQINIVSDKIDKVKGNKNGLTKQLNELNKQLNGMSRKLHYTEEGMLPYNEQYKIYCEKKIEANRLAEVEKERNKPTWEHDMVRNTEAKVGKVIKLSLKK